jgi:hypothetical protein
MGSAKKRLIAAFSILDDEVLVGTYRRRMVSLLSWGKDKGLSEPLQGCVSLAPRLR